MARLDTILSSEQKMMVEPDCSGFEDEIRLSPQNP